MAIKDWPAGELLKTWGRSAVLWFFLFAWGALYQGPSSRPLFVGFLALLLAIPLAMIVITVIWLRGRD